VIRSVAATTSLAPPDLTLSSNEFHLYIIKGMSHAISEFRKGNNTSSQTIGEAGGSPTFAGGLVSK